MPPERAKNGIIRYVFTVPKFGREFVVTSGQLRNIAGYQDSSDTASEWLVANLGIGRNTYGILVCSRNNKIMDPLNAPTAPGRLQSIMTSRTREACDPVSLKSLRKFDKIHAPHILLA